MKVRNLAVKSVFCFAVILATAACGESGAFSPTGPSSLPGVSSQSSVEGFSTLDASRVPAIKVPDGISCPSDAPVVIVSIFGTRLDIEWSPIPGVTTYEVSIDRFTVSNTWAPARTEKVDNVRYELNGQEGSRYRVRVRSHRCGDVGVWSPYVIVTINGPNSIVIAPPDDIEGVVPDYHQPSDNDDDEDEDDNDDETPSCEQWSDEAKGSWRANMVLPCGYWDDYRKR